MKSRFRSPRGWLYLLAFACGVALCAPAAEELGEARDAYRAGDYGVAIRLYRSLAEQGNAEAQIALATIYRDAKGIEKDDAEAVSWFRKATGQGAAEAQYELGVAYTEGHGVARDDAEAAAWVRKAADQGYAEAQTYLGLIYARGQGVPRDDAEAVRWYRLAAGQGYAWGQTNLGYMYSVGRRVARDDVAAVECYRKAAAQGFAMAQHNMGVMYRDGRAVPRDDVEAVKWFRLSAEQNYAEGQSGLAFMYQGGHGVEKDDAEAARWYRKAADRGVARAQASLGVMYAEGVGVQQDTTEAVRWFRLAALQGNASGQTYLAIAYMNGIDGPPDYAQALEWFGKAAGQNYAPAQAAVGRMYENGNGVKADDVEAARWYRLAADQGNPMAQAQLGAMYRDGRGVDKDAAVAAEWLRKSAVQGSKDAQRMLTELDEERSNLQLSRRIAELVKINEAKLPVLPTPDAERLALAREIMAVTEERKTLMQRAASFDDAAARPTPAAANLPPKVIEAIRAVFLASFPPAIIADAIEVRLAESLDAATLHIGLNWERSDLGQRMTRMNVNSMAPERVAGRNELAREFLTKGTPTDDPRARACGQADVLAALTDTALPFFEAILIAATTVGAVDSGRTPDIEEVRRAMLMLRPLLREGARQSWLARCMFDYRELSDAEFAQWLEFLGTDAGGRYTRAANGARKDAVLARTELFAHTLREIMLGFKRERESS